MPTVDLKENISATVFIKTINDLRLKNKNKWVFFTGVVENKKVELKLYNTWLQIYKVNGLDFSNCMDRKPTEFKEDLLKGLNYMVKVK